MNLALLQKWKWRIITEKDTVWCNLLRWRYGEPRLKVIVGNNSVLGPKDSIWWRDLVQSGWSISYGASLFTGAVGTRVFNSCNTAF